MSKILKIMESGLNIIIAIKREISNYRFEIKSLAKFSECTFVCCSNMTIGLDCLSNNRTMFSSYNSRCPIASL